MVYEYKTEKFSGPLEKLLELIEGRKLDVSELSLAEVTADFLNYLKTIGAVSPKILADFVVVASRLVLIKSKALLPALQISEEERADIKDLENRLKIYREVKNAGAGVRRLWESRAALFSRELFTKLSWSPDGKLFFPGENLNADALAAAAKNILNILQEFARETENVKLEIVTLEDKMSELVSRVAETARFGFKELTDKKNKMEIIVTFLAILHLLKEQLISVEQENAFADIIIAKNRP